MLVLFLLSNFWPIFTNFWPLPPLHCLRLLWTALTPNFSILHYLYFQSSRIEFDTKPGFNLCPKNDTIQEESIFLSDWLQVKDFYWFYWMWIYLTLSLVQIILLCLEAKGKISCLSKYFGPPVTLSEFVVGPKIPDAANESLHSMTESAIIP